VAELTSAFGGVRYSPTMNSSDHDWQKKHAALAFALGVTRGALSDVLDGDFSAEAVRRIYDATASHRIASSIGLSESALDVDWNDFLSDVEKHKIQGYDAAEPTGSS